MGLLLGATAVASLSAAAGGCRGPRPAATPPLSSVLLVTLDTTRADYLGSYGQARVRTPHLDALAREGAVFTRAYSSVPLTLPAHASLMTGVTPLVHGVRDNFAARLPERLGTLAQALSARGRQTAAVVGASVLDTGSGIERGFARYDDLRQPGAGSGGGARSGGRGAGSGAAGPGPGGARAGAGADPPGGAERDGAEVVERALAQLERLAGAPFFLWVHLYDAHLPYEPPQPYRDLYPDDPYAGEVAYLDELVGRLAEPLRRSGRRDVLLVVAADHGEGLGEHGEPDHGVFLYDTTLRVPLVLWAPGSVRAARVEQVVRDIDVMPTVLDLLGLDPSPTAEGRSLRPLVEGRPDPERLAYAESDYAQRHYGWSPLRALRDSAYKYIDAPEPELYDLRADPGEARNLIAERGPVADALRGRLLQMAETARGDALAAASGGVAPPGGSSAATSAVDPAALERLRSLGYAGATLPPQQGELPDPKARRGALPALSRATAEAIPLIEGGRAEEALTLLERAVAAEPRFLDGHVLRGEALYRLERFPQAVAAFEQALALDPESGEAHYDLARALAADGRLVRALGELERARALVPRDRRLALAEAELHLAQKRPAQAVAALRRFLAGGDDARVRLALGRALVAQGLRADGERELQAALLEDPSLDTLSTPQRPAAHAATPSR